MAKINCEKIEPFSASQLFLLVNDIPSYTQFVPGCTQSGILSQHNNMIHAYIKMEKLGFSQRFSTQNKLYFPDKIEMSLIDGPFKQLSGEWIFTDLPNQKGKIELVLNFEMKNKILDLTLSPLFNELMKNMVEAFSRQAHQSYTQYEILSNS